MVRKSQLTVEERQTIMTLKNAVRSYREITNKVKMSVSTVSCQNKTKRLGPWNTAIGLLKSGEGIMH